jgi:prepilin-type N-terminal cleavage/methylation domain-containing protein
MERFTKSNRHRQRGVSLVEMCVAMAIAAVLFVGVSNLLIVAETSQINARMQSIEGSVATNIIDRLRADLRFAENDATVSINANNPQVLQFHIPSTGENVTYTFANNTLTRTSSLNNVAYDFGANLSMPVRIYCSDPTGAGKQYFTVNAPNSGNEHSVSLSNLVVEDASGRTSTHMDQSFQGVAGYTNSQYRVADATFNVLNGASYQ